MDPVLDVIVADDVCGGAVEAPTVEGLAIEARTLADG